MIVPHRFPPWLRHWTELDGIYNGQLVMFRNDERGLAALRWWRERCLEWCYDRREDGKFADQKYLDDWPDRFPGVHVLAHPGGGLAPWNARQYALERRNGALLVEGRPLVFYHYQSLELFRRKRLLHRMASWSGAYHSIRAPTALVWGAYEGYRISPMEVELLWMPYVDRLAAAIADVRKVVPDFAACFRQLRARDIGYQLGRRLLPSSMRGFLSCVRRLRRAPRT
jgi:hypothetical protein